MRLAFPNGERDDFAISKGSFSIGNSDQDDVVVNGGSGRAVLTVDRRGITLSIDAANDDDGIRVNSRPVREKAILRLGDRIKFGSVDIVLCSDPIDDRTPPYPFEACGDSQMPAKTLLRGIDGAHAGKVFPVSGTLVVSSDSDADIVVTQTDVKLLIGCKADHVYVRRESGDDALDVNGYEVKHAKLRPGDQLTVGGERFLVETPGLVPGDVYGGQRQDQAGSSNTQVFSARDFSEAAAAAEKKQAGRESEPEAATEPESESSPVKAATPGKGRDVAAVVVIGVCVALSAAMLVWLFLNL